MKFPVFGSMILALTAVGCCMAKLNEEECDQVCNDLLGGGQKRAVQEALWARVADDPECLAFCKALDVNGGGGGGPGAGAFGQDCEELCSHYLGADQLFKRDATWDKIAAIPQCASWCTEMEKEMEAEANRKPGKWVPPTIVRSCDELCEDYLGMGSKKEKRESLWEQISKDPKCKAMCEEMEEEYGEY